MKRRLRLTQISSGFLLWKYALAVAFALGIWPGITPVGADNHARIVFASERDGNMDIYVANPDGTNLRRLTDHPDRDLDPEWSLDGTQIAFTRQDINWEEQGGIYIMDADGSDERFVTQSWGGPAWSPDGNQIAFLGEPRVGVDGAFGIYLIEADGSNRRWLRDVSHIAGPNPPAWSPDGKQLAYIHLSDVYVMDADGKNPRQITQVLGRTQTNVDWSPDGQRLVFTIQVFNPPKHGLYIISADGASEKRLTNQPDLYPQWLPNGQEVIFMRYEEVNPPFPTGSIYLLDVNSGNVRKVIDNGGQPSWFEPALGLSVDPLNQFVTTWGSVKTSVR